jgi:hypothetical protein
MTAHPRSKPLRALLVLPLAVLLLSGCTLVSLVPAQPQQAGALVVVPEQPWNRMDMMGTPTVQVWTKHGIFLDKLVIVQGVADGSRLWADPRNRREQAPFKADMGPDQVAELIMAAAATDPETSGFELTGIQPATFAGRPGFRFTFRFVDSEVPMEAMAAGAIVEGRLYAIVFHGARLHHYRVIAPEVERLIARTELRRA